MNFPPRLVWYGCVTAFATFFAVVLVLPRSSHHVPAGFPVAREDLPAEIDPVGVKMAELPEYLQAKGLNLHVVSVHKNSEERCDGFYLCEQAREWNSVAGIRFLPEYRHEWTGIVQTRLWLGPKDDTIADLLNQQVPSLVARDFMIIGDPQLLTRIREALDAE